MEDFKFMTVWDLLNFLKIRVKHNVDLINLNIIELNEIKENSGVLSQNFSRIKGLTNENAELTMENNHFLGIFNDLLKLHNNYLFNFNNEPAMVVKEPVDSKKTEEEQKKEYFDKTINGELPIDESHPLKKNREFLESVFEHCLKHEEFEKCAAIKHLLN